MEQEGVTINKTKKNKNKEKQKQRKTKQEKESERQRQDGLRQAAFSVEGLGRKQALMVDKEEDRVQKQSFLVEEWQEQREGTVSGVLG